MLQFQNLDIRIFEYSTTALEFPYVTHQRWSSLIVAATPLHRRRVGLNTAADDQSFYHLTKLLSSFQHIPHNFCCRFRRVQSYDKEAVLISAPIYIDISPRLRLGLMSTLGLDIGLGADIKTAV